MKTYRIIKAALISVLTYGQLRTGFNIEGEKLTIAMCISYNFIEQYGNSSGIVPLDFNLIDDFTCYRY